MQAFGRDLWLFLELELMMAGLMLVAGKWLTLVLVEILRAVLLALLRQLPRAVFRMFLRQRWCCASEVRALCVCVTRFLRGRLRRPRQRLG